MKRILYLCMLVLFGENMLAQIDLNDKNWDTIVFDDFNQMNRHFDNAFRDTIGNWIAFTMHTKSGVTKSTNLQIYERNHCIFDGANSVLRLNSEFLGERPVTCAVQPVVYDLPPMTFGRVFECDNSVSPLHYFSGMIESLPMGYSFNAPDPQNTRVKNWPGRYRYGYFEIRCKLPIHQGAFPAFWLWDADSVSPTNQYYEEIDILEFSWQFEDTLAWHSSPFLHGAGYPYSYSTGMFYNGTSIHCDPNSMLSRKMPVLSDSVSNWHTYACEWMPEHVIWYCDGKKVNEFYDQNRIPRHGLALKTNYSIDKYALGGNAHEGNPVWRGSDSMVIDHIKVFQLKWDCDTDAVITSQSDMDGFQFKVKKSIAITSTIEPVRIRPVDKVTFRATDSFEITGPFQVDAGGEMTVIMQTCPDEP